MISVPTPFAAKDLIFVFSGYRRFVQPIYALRAGKNGDIAWRTQKGAPYLPTPIVTGDNLYIVQINGILACYRAANGDRLYEERLGQGGAYSASPVAADGRIYFTSEDGDVYVLKAGDKYELLATNHMGETCMATPAISRNMLLYRTRSHLVAIGQK
jgi:outer membrane protein assembly factor BamB